MTTEQHSAIEAEHHGPPHPTPIQYVKIAVVLAVLTGIEVALFYVGDVFGGLQTPMLLVLAALKFVIVVGWYMHLRFERSTAQRFFGTGFVIALFCYGIVLLAMGAFALSR